ncbi:hypothetical protein FMM05_18900 [Flavobacterium zepuense]|uniref:Signal transducer regulating beta-lactamase production, contains metallopeptidase domain n=1 Tax=Flavobacterium zepuense TaxID=2593302 RepID=A0A552UUX0_9FLAO|nr:M56 family metallopeptidase [Flavobacterium zepuense]TRW22024.1 hypothetical protein FMM05_18900 [Flavobacterium zepuense]
MIDFLLKSTISMALLLAVYHLFLAKEKMHRFNRFYLLFSIAFSFLLPFVSFTINSPVMAQPLNELTTILLAPAIISAPNKTNYLPYISWGIYGFVTLLLLLRFAVSLLHFKRQVNYNEHSNHKGAVLVLVNANILPHTFLNYIFINKEEHDNQVIEDELYTHELAHVHQHHTVDVLFIEVLKTVFWFNPLLYFYKKAIQLNHEFLADETVVNAAHNVITYQQLLLQKATKGHTFALASNLNFAITKKRLLMMTKTTPRLLATIKQLAIVPLLAGLVLVSCADEANDVNESAIKGRQAAVQNAIEDTNENFRNGEIHNSASLTKQPEYPGGMGAFYYNTMENFKIPDGLNGNFRVYVSFVIEPDGTLSNAKVLRDPSKGGILGTEALRVLKSTGEKWLPGEINGTPVRTSYNLPITVNIVD